MLDEGVAGFGQDGDEVREREGTERDQDRDPAEEFGDQAVGLEIGGEDVVEWVEWLWGVFWRGYGTGRGVLEVRAEADGGAGREPRGDYLFEADEGPGEDEEDVGGVDGVLLALSGLLAYASVTATALHAVGSSSTAFGFGGAVRLGVYCYRRAFDHLQQSLLYAFS